MLGRVGEALLQVLERPTAPILVDRVGEGLPVAFAPVEIDANRCIARSRKEPRVPAVRPAIVETALRPSVDEENETVYVNRTKDQIKNAPEYDESLTSDEDYRSRLGSYYGPGGTGYRDEDDL